MTGRFFGIVGDDAALRKRSIDAAQRTVAFRTVIDRSDLMLFVETGTPRIDLGDGALILGTFFTPSLAGPLTNLSPQACQTIAMSRGDHLIHAYWGSYLAIFADRPDGSVEIVRAPFGGLPCFYTAVGDSLCFASDVDLLVEFGSFERRVDWPALARHLTAGDIRRSETCLEKLFELRGGDRLRLGNGSPQTETLWSPWTHAAAARQFRERDEAVRRLRDHALYCVKARRSAFDHGLLLLSGGLDSSIIAACMADTGKPFDCLTIITENPSGDERDYAALAAGHVGAPLTIRQRALARIDVMRSAAGHLARPNVRLFEQDSQAISAAIAVQTGADIVLDGGGGDNLFCSLQSVAPVADCLLTDDPAARFWPMAREIGALAETGALTVAWRAWRRSRRRSRGFVWKRDLRFLSPEAIGWSVGATDHPWLDAPPDALPGKAAHIALLLGAQGLAEDHDPLSGPRTMSVLVAQPLVETCIRIPSWYWFARGRNRAAVRSAFEADLPEAISWRRSKGTPDSFVVEIYEHHRPAIRDVLVEGLLAQNGVIDVDAIARVMDDPRPTIGQDFVRIMQLFDAEIWARAQETASGRLT